MSVWEYAWTTVVEEAGVVGTIVRPLCSSDVQSSRGANAASCIHWFELATEQVLDQWPDQLTRSRQWVSVFSFAFVWCECVKLTDQTCSFCVLCVALSRQVSFEDALTTCRRPEMIQALRKMIDE